MSFLHAVLDPFAPVYPLEYGLKDLGTKSKDVTQQVDARTREKPGHIASLNGSCRALVLLWQSAISEW